MTHLKLYLLAFAVFIVVDLIWLVLVARTFYKKHLGFIMADKPNWAAALIFYAVYLLGVVYFVIYPAYQTGNWQSALVNGLFFGFVTYATYDLTNLATLKDWPLTVTLVDLAWGTSLGGLVSTLTYSLAKLLSL